VAVSLPGADEPTSSTATGRCSLMPPA